MDERFFKEQIDKFKKRELVNPDFEDELYQILFRDLSQIPPDKLQDIHKELAREAEDYFSYQEDYEKAQKLKQYQETIDEIIKAKERIKSITSNMNKK